MMIIILAIFYIYIYILYVSYIFTRRLTSFRIYITILF